MALLRLLVVALVLPLLGGCYGVYSTQVVGEKPLVLEPEKWEGTWVHRDVAITAVVMDKARGLLEVGWTEKKQGKLVFEKHRVELRQSGKWIFGNVRHAERPKLTVWSRVQVDGDQIILWMPDRNRFEAMVRNRSIEGRNEKTGEDVILTGFTPETVSRIMNAEGGAPLDWERPLVFQRLSRQGTK